MVDYLAVLLPGRETIFLGKVELDSHGWKAEHSAATHLVLDFPLQQP